MKIKYKYKIYSYIKRGEISWRPLYKSNSIDEILKWLKEKHPNITIGSKIGNFTIQEHFNKAPWIKNINSKIRKILS